MAILRELYQEVIVDHSRHPRHFGILEPSTHHAEGYNPLCGDRLTLYLNIKGDLIESIMFQGTGCAISTASASLLTEFLEGKTVAEAESLFRRFHAALIEGEEERDLGKLSVLMGVKEFPARVKCATLAWHTLHAALQHQPLVSTEPEGGLDE